MVAAARKEVTKTKFFFTKINNFIILINIVLNRITIALIKTFFDKISIIIQVELMAGGRMSLSWEFKEERLHFTLVSSHLTFHIGEHIFDISHWSAHISYFTLVCSHFTYHIGKFTMHAKMPND